MIIGIGEQKNWTERRRPLVKTLMLLGIVGGPCLAGAAPAQAGPTASTVEHACSADMEFKPGSSDYSICLSVLGRMKALADQRTALQQKRLACTDKGLQDGTRAFAVCVLDQPDQVGSVAGDKDEIR